MTITREVVTSAKSPAAIGPYSAGIRTGNLLFVSGTLGMDPITGELVAGGIEGETRQALKNLENILVAGGASLASVVKTTVYMQNLGEFPAMNAIYGEVFFKEPPARSTVEVAALPKHASVEIEAIALILEPGG